MPNDDLIFKMLMDLDTNPALKKIDNLSKILESSIGKTFSELKIGKDYFSQIFKFDKQRSTSDLDVFRGIVREGNNAVEAILRVDKATKKVRNFTTDFATPEKLAEEFNLDLTNYKGKVAINEQKEIQKELAKTEKIAKKAVSPIGRLINTIKRVGFYRLARGFFAELKNIFAQGLEGLITFDKGVNTTVSKMASSYDQIKGSVALIVTPVLESLLPAVESITTSISNFANNISMASAASKGMTTYTKINDKYFKDMAAQANKMNASFDKFESMNGKESVFITGNIDEDKNDSVSAYQDILESIKGTISSITDALGSLFSIALKIYNNILKQIAPSLFKIIEFFVKFVSNIITTLDKLGLLETTISAIIATIVAFKSIEIGKHFVGVGKSLMTLITKFQEYQVQLALAKTKTEIFRATWKSLSAAILSTALSVVSLVANWKEMSDGARTATIVIASLTAAVAALAFGILAAQGKWAKALSVATGVVTAGTTVLSAVSMFADGGMVDRGTLFVAGESGAEVVTQMPSGQTGVTNVAQFKQAMVEALYEAQDVFQNQQSEVVLNLDGAAVARSKNFKRELNRTNSGLNLI